MNKSSTAPFSGDVFFSSSSSPSAHPPRAPPSTPSLFQWRVFSSVPPPSSFSSSLPLRRTSPSTPLSSPPTTATSTRQRGFFSSSSPKLSSPSSRSKEAKNGLEDPGGGRVLSSSSFSSYDARHRRSRVDHFPSASLHPFAEEQSFLDPTSSLRDGRLSSKEGASSLFDSRADSGVHTPGGGQARRHQHSPLHAGDGSGAVRRERGGRTAAGGEQGGEEHDEDGTRRREKKRADESEGLYAAMGRYAPRSADDHETFLRDLETRGVEAILGSTVESVKSDRFGEGEREGNFFSDGHTLHSILPPVSNADVSSHSAGRLLSAGGSSEKADKRRKQETALT